MMPSYSTNGSSQLVVFLPVWTNTVDAVPARFYFYLCLCLRLSCHLSFFSRSSADFFLAFCSRSLNLTKDWRPSLISERPGNSHTPGLAPSLFKGVRENSVREHAQ